jgi:hypothetical protein
MHLSGSSGGYLSDLVEFIPMAPSRPTNPSPLDAFSIIEKLIATRSTEKVRVTITNAQAMTKKVREEQGLKGVPGVYDSLAVQLHVGRENVDREIARISNSIPLRVPAEYITSRFGSRAQVIDLDQTPLGVVRAKQAPRARKGTDEYALEQYKNLLITLDSKAVHLSGRQDNSGSPQLWWGVIFVGEGARTVRNLFAVHFNKFSAGETNKAITNPKAISSPPISIYAAQRSVISMATDLDFSERAIADLKSLTPNRPVHALDVFGFGDFRDGLDEALAADRSVGLNDLEDRMPSFTRQTHAGNVPLSSVGTDMLSFIKSVATFPGKQIARTAGEVAHRISREISRFSR